jgi:hypothetical protein
MGEEEEKYTEREKRKKNERNFKHNILFNVLKDAETIQFIT